MAVKNSDDSKFLSNDDFLIRIDGIGIINDRNKIDFAYLTSFVWSGLLVGTNGYHAIDRQNYYCYIAGGDEDEAFKATAIEFYGVKTQT